MKQDLPADAVGHDPAPRPSTDLRPTRLSYSYSFTSLSRDPQEVCQEGVAPAFHAFSLGLKPKNTQKPWKFLVVWLIEAREGHWPLVVERSNQDLGTRPRKLWPPGREHHRGACSEGPKHLEDDL